MPANSLYKVKVRAGARQDRLTRRGQDSFEIWVRAPAERGLANRAVLSLLSAELKLPAKRLRIIKGANSPSKIVSILGLVL
jgi:uncharacterized protein YggU (UPF0235/DUF167 family)